MKLLFLLLQITKMFSSFSAVSRIVLILIWLRHTYVYCMEDDDIKVFEKPADSTADCWRPLVPCLSGPLVLRTMEPCPQSKVIHVNQGLFYILSYYHISPWSSNSYMLCLMCPQGHPHQSGPILNPICSFPPQNY